MIVSSKQNKIIKDTNLLKDKKHRKLLQKTIVEGLKLIFEAKNNGYGIESLFFVEKFKNDISSLGVDSSKCFLVTDEIINYISNTVTPQGILAIINTNKKFNEYDNENFLLLDNLQDPQNMGAIVRTAVACGIKNIFAINCVDFFNDKVIRSSAGNIFKANLYCIDVDTAFKMFDKNILYCADMNGKNLFDIKQINKPFGIVIGNEGNGISDELMCYANKKISIPMQNNVESLNANVSASIILYYLSFIL